MLGSDLPTPRCCHHLLPTSPPSCSFLWPLGPRDLDSTGCQAKPRPRARQVSCGIEQRLRQSCSGRHTGAQPEKASSTEAWALSVQERAQELGRTGTGAGISIFRALYDLGP